MLGHILGFSLGEMQWFLLRVLQEADGFRFQLSQDLIEAYGFLTNASWQKVRSLHQRYETLSANIQKADSSDRNDQWTRNVSDTLPGKVEQWTRYPESQDENFMEWLLALSPGLDIPSRTAQRIYRNMAAYAYRLIKNQEQVPCFLSAPHHGTKHAPVHRLRR